jgi:hypothetical protein
MAIVDSTFSMLRPSTRSTSPGEASIALFYRVIPCKKVMPLGCICSHITFGKRDNFRKELLTFEVVEFLAISRLASVATFHEVHGRSQQHLPRAKDAYSKRVITVGVTSHLLKVGPAYI